MELFERDEALVALTDARELAAGGRGRVVFVTGEPGIGKTSLVNRFVQGLDDRARVLVGACDDLSIPRPLGPFRDLVGSVSAPLAEALSTGGAAHDIHRLLIDELEQRPRPTVLVVEDVHWADDATLDTITFLGRRIASLPAVLVVTLRAGEAPPGHPLHAAVGAVRAEDSIVLELAALSAGAVATIAGGDAERVYAATRGNPFYVTELVASRDAADLPASVANAVLGRMARLGAPARRLLELISVVPNRAPTALLDAVEPEWALYAEEPERRQLLEVRPGHVCFRHELARHAVEERLPIAVRRRLHAQILEVLLATDADPAEIVHHAEAAGAEAVVADYALVAARRAAALGSNREAFCHFRRASDFAERLPRDEQAVLAEELAGSAYLAGRLDEAVSAIERAIAIHASLDAAEAVGRSTRLLSRFQWFGGQGDASRSTGLQAIAILEPLGDSVELARAYAGMATLAALAPEPAQAMHWGERALELATRLGDEPTRAYALVNLGTVRLQLDPTATATLVEAHSIADAAGEHHQATRALGNLCGALLYWGRAEAALEFGQQALAYAEEHDVQMHVSYFATMLASLRLHAGEWDAAERVARDEVQRDASVSQVFAQTLLAELAIRRGDPNASEQLADLTESVDRSGDLQRITPVLELAIEQALMSGTAMPVERFEHVVALARSRAGLTGWAAARLAAWGAVAGIDVDWAVPATTTPPLSAMAVRDWRAAADAFGEAGWSHDRALMLSLLDDEEPLTEAIGIARELGAEPLTRRVALRMRERGLSVPHGPRQATRANPAGLTARQVEVLSLLIAGHTNAEIADQLVVSPRTAEHHVAAVLTKIGAGTRRDAARRASELGLSRASLPRIEGRE